MSCVVLSALLIYCSVAVIQRWREFCNLFEGQVEDWNMATLLRVDASGDVSEENSVIGASCCLLLSLLVL